MGQQRFGVSPTFVLLANQVSNRHSSVFKQHFIEAVLAIDSYDRLNSHTGSVHVDQQKANTLLLTHTFTSTHQTKNPICILSKCSPNLATINNVVIACIFCSGV